MSRKSPSVKGLKRFTIPHGVYVQVTGQINRELLRVYRRFRRGSITKPQAKAEGEKVIKAARERIHVITRRWFAKNNLEPEVPETEDEVDDFTRDKIEEWGRIVADM